MRRKEARQIEMGGRLPRKAIHHYQTDSNMINTRTGKIARLSNNVREQLNHRLADGESGKKLLAWLNELPEVRAVLVAEFGGRPVNAPNLTAWRQGGYRDWLMESEARSLAENLGRKRTGDCRSLMDVLMLSLAGRYTAAIDRLPEAAGGEDYQRWLGRMCHDVVTLNRAMIAKDRMAGIPRRQEQKAENAGQWGTSIQPDQGESSQIKVI
jgi:hypothetical protein